ncbi:hypothetical protein LUZ60_012408 [Juncus effusus]|nr:hypothetical protein LUZ60_012408 [Juncus effusus]
MTRYAPTVITDGDNDIVTRTRAISLSSIIFSKSPHPTNNLTDLCGIMALETPNEMSSNIVKLERFDGSNFIRWQRKVRFLLTIYNVSNMLNTKPPEKKENETQAETRNRTKLEGDDYACRNYVLNALSEDCTTSFN